MHVDLIAQTLFDNKAANILALDLSCYGGEVRAVVIAEGNVDRHVRALSSSVAAALQEKGDPPIRLEGKMHGDWTVLDFGETMVHLFAPEMRERYQLEMLWDAASIIPVKINASRNQG